MENTTVVPLLEKRLAPKRRGVFRILIPVSMMTFGIYIQWTANSFIRNSSSISAELISSSVKYPRITRNPRGLDSIRYEYWVHYRFNVDGESYSGQGSVKPVSLGPLITVYYEIGNPANNRPSLPSELEGWVWIWFAFFAAILMNRRLWLRSTDESKPSVKCPDGA